MNVAQCVGATLARLGVSHVFGVVGSGNFHLTNAMVAAGARFVAARHEGGATTMADAYARMSGSVCAVSVHQGCGFTNTLTGLAEAAKSRTPMVVLAADVTDARSNFAVDQDALAVAVGAVPLRIGVAGDASAVTRQAFHIARDERRTVVLNVPLAVQADDVSAELTDVVDPALPAPSAAAGPHDAVPDRFGDLVEALRRAERPVFVAGRGARGPGCRTALEQLAQATGALLATSAVAKGLFHDNPWSLDVAGGFSSPLAAELIGAADLIVGWGCVLNHWTMRHGTLIAPDAVVVQVDLDPSAIGRHRHVHIGVVGDVHEVAVDALERLGGRTRRGYRTEQQKEEIATRVRWRDVPYDDLSTGDHIDPRTLTIRLDDLLPRERVVGVDSGNFMGYPSMFLSVPDEFGFCFTQAFQSIGLGLSTAIGAALAQPGRLPVAALGDGGGLMGVAELETVVRLGLPMVVIVYNDDGYGAEFHHFRPGGDDLSTVRFPPTDIAAIGRGFGFEAVTVRREADMAAVRDWVSGDRRRPLLIDAKVTNDQPSWWLEEAFRASH
ncbi:MAG TPA: thiamine pyrophosphate-binding protein [Actinopolymorphaceae bacterium]|nr:thiamine pyrophosphate-binding protein [Actinopolymorphaceae bacterium]